METVSRELEAVAAAVARLRSATGSVARVQAVRDAARSMDGLSSADSQVLARGLIEHGAPAAAEVLARHSGQTVPEEQLVSVAQGLLALDPGEAERFAAELRDPQQRARLASEAAAALPATATTATTAPPPIPAVARSRPRPTASRQSKAERPRSRPRDPAGPEPAEQDVNATERRPSHGVGTAPALPRARAAAPLLAELRNAPDARARFALFEDPQAVRTAVEEAGVAALLEAVPDGWQRRTVLRRALDATRGAAIEDEAFTVVASFRRRGDRFAAASLLQRDGSADPDAFRRLLGSRDADRLRLRAADRAVRGGAG